MARLPASRFSGGQCGKRALENHPGFRVAIGGHYIECQAICGGHVAGHELDTGNHEVRDEGHGTSLRTGDNGLSGGWEIIGRGDERMVRRMGPGPWGPFGCRQWWEQDATV